MLRLLFVVAGVLLVAGCSTDPADRSIIVDDRFTLECRGVEPETCLAIGEAAADEVPAGSIVARARLAPAQTCLGETPCGDQPPSCTVYASVLFDMPAINELVINVVGPAEELQVVKWDGPADLGEHPIRDDVGSLCTSLPGVP